MKNETRRPMSTGCVVRWRVLLNGFPEAVGTSDGETEFFAHTHHLSHLTRVVFPTGTVALADNANFYEVPDFGLRFVDRCPHHFGMEKTFLRDSCEDGHTKQRFVVHQLLFVGRCEHCDLLCQ